MLCHCFFFPAQSIPHFQNSRQWVPSIYLITISKYLALVKRILNTCYLCFSVLVTFLDDCVWLLAPWNLLNLAGTWECYSGPFSFFCLQAPLFHPPLTVLILRILPQSTGALLILSPFPEWALSPKLSSDRMLHIHLNPLLYKNEFVIFFLRSVWSRKYRSRKV